MDFLKWADGRKMPKALQTRTGWAQFFEHHRSEEPHIHQIEPTNHCPYECIMCPRHANMKRKKGFMEMDLFRKIIDETATFSPKTRDKEIELFHFGESLFHPQLPEMVSYASAAGLKPTLSINPGDLNHTLIDDLLASNPYKIIVSLDSMHAQKYKNIRGNYADIERAVANNKLLLKAQQKLNSTTKIITRMIVMKNNQDEVEDYVKFWEANGSTVELRDFFPWNHEELKKLGMVKKYPTAMPCPFPWQYIVVQWNGDVVACCRDYNGILKLGNVHNLSLKEIWNGQSYQDFREKMSSSKDLPNSCQECLSIYYTEPDNDS